MPWPRWPACWDISMTIGCSPFAATIGQTLSILTRVGVMAGRPMAVSSPLTSHPSPRSKRPDRVTSPKAGLATTLGMCPTMLRASSNRWEDASVSWLDSTACLPRAFIGMAMNPVIKWLTSLIMQANLGAHNDGFVISSILNITTLRVDSLETTMPDRCRLGTSSLALVSIPFVPYQANMPSVVQSFPRSRFH